MTWTLFAADGTGYIYEAYSRDYGESFSSPQLVSKTSSLCSNTLGTPTPQGTCNANQFSQPFTAPDGALYVVWDNYNLTGVRPGEGDEGGGDDGASAAAGGGSTTAPRSCSPSRPTAGSTFSSPVKVADYYDLPDCETYQDADEGVGLRAGEGARPRTRSSAPPTTRRRRSTRSTRTRSTSPSPPTSTGTPTSATAACRRATTRTPSSRSTTGVKTAGACNNDILISRSTDGGQVVHRRLDQRPQAAVGAQQRAPRRPVLAVGGLRSQRPPRRLLLRPRLRQRRETGFSDVSLSGSRQRRRTSAPSG